MGHAWKYIGYLGGPVAIYSCIWCNAIGHMCRDKIRLLDNCNVEDASSCVE